MNEWTPDPYEGQQTPPARSADDLLPPVEPPSAAFVMKLFVVPAVIVLSIIAVWMGVNWLATSSKTSESYLRGLQSGAASRWHAAMNLATALRSDQDGKLRASDELAAKLSEILEAEIEAGEGLNETPDKRSEEITFRVYLCRALGGFTTAEGIDSLIKAATTQRSDAEIDVRLAAIQALCVRATNLAGRSQFESQRTRVQEVFLSGIDPEQPITVRSASAYGLGVLGGEAALARLASIVGEGESLQPSEGGPAGWSWDLYYNSVTGLARHGDERALPGLQKMLAENQTGAVKGEDVDRDQPLREWKADLIRVNGLIALRTLVKKESNIDASPLVSRIEELTADDQPTEVQEAAKDLLADLAQDVVAQAQPTRTND